MLSIYMHYLPVLHNSKLSISTFWNLQVTSSTEIGQLQVLSIPYEYFVLVLLLEKYEKFKYKYLRPTSDKMTWDN